MKNKQQAERQIIQKSIFVFWPVTIWFLENWPKKSKQRLFLILSNLQQTCITYSTLPYLTQPKLKLITQQAHPEQKMNKKLNYYYD